MAGGPKAAARVDVVKEDAAREAVDPDRTNPVIPPTEKAVHAVGAAGAGTDPVAAKVAAETVRHATTDLHNPKSPGSIDGPGLFFRA